MDRRLECNGLAWAARRPSARMLSGLTQNERSCHQRQISWSSFSFNRLLAADPPGLKMQAVRANRRRVKPGKPIEVSTTLRTGAQSVTGLSVYFYDGNPPMGGKVFDVERIAHIPANSQYQVQVHFSSTTCGLHRLFVQAGPGKAYTVSGRSQWVYVNCPLQAE